MILDSGQIAVVSFRAEARLDGLEVGEQFPEHVFRHLRVASRIGVRESVASRQFKPGPVPLIGKCFRDVANPVERLLARELDDDEREQVAPRVERPPLDIVALRSVLDELARDERCNLTKDGVYCPRCFWEWCFFHVG